MQQTWGIRFRLRFDKLSINLSGILLAFSVSSFAGESNLAQLINDRLELMDEVAAYKFHHHIAIENIDREKIVLDHAVSAGLEYGIRKDSSQIIFGLQIEAAKEIQQYWFTYWQSHEPPAESPDLNEVVRPKLIRLGNAISGELVHGSQLKLETFMETLDIQGLSPGTKRALYESVFNIEFYEDRLEQILDSGRLRVGTTGDYAPFSYQKNSEDEFSGIDIDLAKDLASSLGVELLLIKTSWPTLLQDLDANRYDIAMSGVSRNLERQKSGFFSAAYHVGGKTPISLCENVYKFNSMEKIDVRGNRLIVNPGGTNERFVDAHLKFATKILHNDNRTIFDAIIHGDADLMITDNIEVRLQTSIHPELCATMPDKNLTYQEKGFLMPQDPKLKEYVDLWLATRKGDGRLQSTFDKFLR